MLNPLLTNSGKLEEWKIPKTALLTSGNGSAQTELTAFDNALLDAGIGDLNLIKVTSILPPGARILRFGDCKLNLPKGALVPAVYTHMTGITKGLTISSALGIGIPKDKQANGVIFEASAAEPKEKTEMLVRQMVSEAFKARNLELTRCIVVSSEIEIFKQFACTIAAVLLVG